MRKEVREKQGEMSERREWVYFRRVLSSNFLVRACTQYSNYPEQDRAQSIQKFPSDVAHRESLCKNNTYKAQSSYKQR